MTALALTNARQGAVIAALHYSVVQDALHDQAVFFTELVQNVCLASWTHVLNLGSPFVVVGGNLFPIITHPHAFA